jgi:hypothetical protein
LSNKTVVLKPGLSLILISVFLTPLSNSISFATFLNNSIAWSLVKSSLKLSKRASTISLPLNPYSCFCKINAS